jgi:hypothetical protein
MPIDEEKSMMVTETTILDSIREEEDDDGEMPGQILTQSVRDAPRKESLAPIKL